MLQRQHSHRHRHSHRHQRWRHQIAMRPPRHLLHHGSQTLLDHNQPGLRSGKARRSRSSMASWCLWASRTDAKSCNFNTLAAAFVHPLGRADRAEILQVHERRQLSAIPAKYVASGLKSDVGTITGKLCELRPRQSYIVCDNNFVERQKATIQRTRCCSRC